MVAHRGPKEKESLKFDDDTPENDVPHLPETPYSTRRLDSVQQCGGCMANYTRRVDIPATMI